MQPLSNGTQKEMTISNLKVNPKWCHRNRVPIIIRHMISEIQRNIPKSLFKIRGINLREMGSVIYLLVHFDLSLICNNSEIPVTHNNRSYSALNILQHLEVIGQPAPFPLCFLWQDNWIKIILHQQYRHRTNRRTSEFTVVFVQSVNTAGPQKAPETLFKIRV